MKYKLVEVMKIRRIISSWITIRAVIWNQVEFLDTYSSFMISSLFAPHFDEHTAYASVLEVSSPFFKCSIILSFSFKYSRFLISFNNFIKIILDYNIWLDMIRKGFTCRTFDAFSLYVVWTVCTSWSCAFNSANCSFASVIIKCFRSEFLLIVIKLFCNSQFSFSSDFILWHQIDINNNAQNI